MEDAVEMCRFFSTGGFINLVKEDSKSQKIPLVPVRRWCFKFRPSTKGALFPGFNIHIKGCKRDKENTKDIYWVSSKVLEVRTDRIVRTRSAAYYLYNSIDVEESSGEGFDFAFNKHFENGFKKGWSEIFELYGKYMIQKSYSISELSQRLTANQLKRRLPNNRFFFKHMPGREEESLHNWIQKNDAWNQAPSKRKCFDGDMELKLHRVKLQALKGTSQSECFKPINSKWSVKDVEKLYEVVKIINPCSDSDWDKVMNVFGQEHSLDEVKEQAEPMLFDFDQTGTPQVDLVKKLKNLAPNGKLPRKGTLRRQVLSDELCKIIFLRKKVENKNQSLEFDSDDEFVHDAVEDPNLESTAISDESMLGTNMAQITYGLMNDSCLGSSENPIEIGDDFDMSNSRSNRYSYQYSARQLNPQFRHSQEDIDENCVELFSDDEECGVVYSNTSRVKQEEEDYEMRIKLELD